VQTPQFRYLRVTSVAKPLTAIAVRNARPDRSKAHPREIPDGGCTGLRLAIQHSGHKSWVVRYRFRGLSRKLTLGPALVGEIKPADVAPEIGTPLSLAEARELATRALREAKGGIDPAAVKRAERNKERAADADTMRAVCNTYVVLVKRERPIRSIKQKESDLDLICEQLGALPLDTISREQFIHQFDIISETRGPVRADRVQTTIQTLLSWYARRRTGYINVLAGVERRISIKARARKRTLNDEELTKVWLTAEKFPAPFGPYVRFVLLTATRRNEASDMRRVELTAPDTWVIPWQRYKTGEKSKTDVLIPLSKAAQAIVEAQPPGQFVFASRAGKLLTNFARLKKKFDQQCGITENWTIHDLRRTARTLLSRVTTPDTAERCLGHALGGVRGTYDLHDYESEKRAAFEALAQRIELIVRPPPAATVADLADARKKRKRTA
jgi:hypothetical protein